MKKIITLFLLTMLVHYGQCQNVKSHVVEIPNHGIYIPNQTFNITSVLDNRIQKETIGTAQKGMSNRQVDVVFSKPVEDYLLGYFQNNLPTYTDVTEVVLKVDRLSVSERTMATKEIGFADLAIEVLVEENGEIFSFGKFEANIEESGLDVTSGHGERIYQVLMNCLHQFSSSEKQMLAFVPIEEKSGFLDYKPLMRKGLFKSYSEWVNLDSGNESPTGFKIKGMGEGGKFPRYQPMDEKTNKRIKGIFAFSDGESFYLNASQYTAADYFVKAQLVGPYFLFEDQVTDAAATASFGLVGALASTKTNLYLFNPKFGTVRVLDDRYIKELLSGHPEILKAWEISDGKREIKKDLMVMLNEVLQEKD
ncbi:DUF6563 family protein [Aquiflexum lacus]|uniref:DUF6563 family protein n=1 Tax=Aquiflexum lacus TaxID=2483805 RepID=UPI001895CCE4|nr:DUF6563 family protein [Aquiflexum lacus]